jgi:hypothetical protein
LTEQTTASMQHLADRMKIVRVVDESDNSPDAKDWSRCRGYFTDELYADFTSLAGGEPGPGSCSRFNSTDRYAILQIS